jgi:predicted nucleic acid-binding protein
VRVLYVDTSALVRAYLPDEPEHDGLRETILEADEPVTTSELSRVEIARALKAAERAGRLNDAAPVLKRIDADLSGKPILTIRLDSATVVPRSRELVLAHRLRTLDALHLAVALGLDAFAEGAEIVLVTRDADQASAARALGLALL